MEERPGPVTCSGVGPAKQETDQEEDVFVEDGEDEPFTPAW